MPNLLRGLFGMLQGRIDHVPEADMPEVLATVNSERPAGRPPLDEVDWRDMEATQVLYAAGRLIRQVTPKPLLPAVTAAVGAEAAREEGNPA